MAARSPEPTLAGIPTEILRLIIGLVVDGELEEQGVVCMNSYVPGSTVLDGVNTIISNCAREYLFGRVMCMFRTPRKLACILDMYNNHEPSERQPTNELLRFVRVTLHLDIKPYTYDTLRSLKQLRDLQGVCSKLIFCPRLELISVEIVVSKCKTQQFLTATLMQNLFDPLPLGVLVGAAVVKCWRCLKYLRAHNKDVSYIEADVPRWNWVKHRDSSNTVITIRPLDRVYRHNSGSTEKLVRAPGTAGDEDELFNVNIDNNTLIIGGCSLITKQRRKCAHKSCGARLFRRNHEGNQVKKATFRCARCRLSEYCSEYCRKSDKFHKRVCTKIPEPLAGCHWAAQEPSST